MLTLTQLGASFLIGLLATSSPCVFPLYPGFLAYLSSTSQRIQGRRPSYVLGGLVLLGVLTAILLVGLVVASLSLALGKFLSVATPAIYLVVISLGILMLLNINPFTRLPQMRTPLLSSPLATSYIYGLLYGPVVLPCSGPVAVGVFALSFTVGQFLDKMALFFVFGLGFGMPLLLLSLVAEVKGGWLTNLFAARHTLMNRIAGIILIGVGLWGFRTVFPALRIYF